MHDELFARFLSIVNELLMWQIHEFYQRQRDAEARQRWEAFKSNIAHMKENQPEYFL